MIAGLLKLLIQAFGNACPEAFFVLRLFLSIKSYRQNLHGRGGKKQSKYLKYCFYENQLVLPWG
jgi:hypothetical protein